MSLESCYIDVRDACLSYPSSPYNAMSIKEWFCHLARRPQTKLIKDVYALKGISFHVREGERVGIIGANGAGKSTILKAIAGVYPLESGCVHTLGSIRSLFELNLGFESEATGRENIMYRGLLLGEHPDVIRSKEQGIIDFADIGEFIDYPVKTYSSGMLVRLAFAISTSIRGDIILLDEVIGAGDASFIQKANQRIRTLMDKAKILVLVSHDLKAVQNFCSRVLWLDHGQLKNDGKANEVIKDYLQFVKER